MAGGNISPRQRMINMMYLVLTALLALNVSKEVLNSFFEVNLGIERSTNNFNSKNGDTYAAFDAAAELNKVKAGPFRDQAYEVKASADELVESIQEMKYTLVLAADKEVYLGSQLDLRDEDGDLLEDKAITTPWDELSDAQKRMTIGNLTVKDDRHASGDLFYSAKNSKNIATDLKNNLIAYKSMLLSIAEGNESIITTINETCNYDDKKVKGKKQLWEEYNFYDMPSVGALTLLSKMQSDVRNTEADIINMLRENIDAGALKFTSAEGISIPQSNFVLRGDSFRAQIFISAKDTTQAPMIYVGEYDSLGNGKYQMRGTEGVDYEVVKVVNGKGMFSDRTKSEGVRKYGGLIAMKTANGTKTYPFNGEYLVAAKTAVVAPTNMNVLYLAIPNPISVSVPGYPASKLIVSTNNGSIKVINKNLGKYEIIPNKLVYKNSPIIKIHVNEDGKRKHMGDAEFKVKDVPDPVPMCSGKRGGLLSKDDLIASQMIVAQMKDFPFDRDALSFAVTSFDIVAYYQGQRSNYPKVKGGRFNSDVREAINSTKPGTEITFSNITVKRRGVKGSKQRDLGSITFKIK